MDKKYLRRHIAWFTSDEYDNDIDEMVDDVNWFMADYGVENINEHSSKINAIIPIIYVNDGKVYREIVVDYYEYDEQRWTMERENCKT